jgi:hypothetical protein
LFAETGGHLNVWSTEHRAGIILGWIGITIIVAGVILISLHPNKP